MCGSKVGPTSLLLSTSHRQTPERKFGHRVYAEHTTIVKALARVIEQVIEIGWMISTHAVPEHDIVTTSDNLQGAICTFSMVCRA